MLDRQIPPPFWRALLRAVLALGAFLAMQWLATEAYALLLMQFSLTQTTLQLLFSIGRLLATAVLAFPLYCLVLRYRPRAACRLLSRAGNRSVSTGRAIVLILAGVSLAMAVLSALVLAHMQNPALLSPGTGMDLAVFVLRNILVMPILEELMFRGMVLDTLRPFGPTRAIVCSTLLFAVGHLDIFNLLIALPLGALLGLIAYRTENLRLTALLHGSANLYGGLLVPLALTHGGPAVPHVILILSLALLTAGIVLLAKDHGRTAAERK